MSAPREVWALVRDNGTLAGVYRDQQDAELERQLAAEDGHPRNVHRYVLAPGAEQEPESEQEERVEGWVANWFRDFERGDYAEFYFAQPTSVYGLDEWTPATLILRRTGQPEGDKTI